MYLTGNGPDSLFRRRFLVGHMEFLVTRLPAELDQRHGSSCAVVKHETRFVFATPNCKTARMAQNNSGDEYDDATEDLSWQGGTFSGLEVVSRAMPARKTGCHPLLKPEFSLLHS